MYIYTLTCFCMLKSTIMGLPSPYPSTRLWSAAPCPREERRSCLRLQQLSNTERIPRFKCVSGDVLPRSAAPPTLRSAARRFCLPIEQAQTSNIVDGVIV